MGETMQNSVKFLESPGLPRLAYSASPGAGPGVVFLGGFGSDMTGTKATALEAAVTARGNAYLRLDYSGHGQSGGRFVDGTIGQWFADALAVFDAVTTGPQVVVGSSMGGWIGLLLARARPDRVKAFVGIAAAPDFTARLMAGELTGAQRETLKREGVLYRPSDYGDPMPITAKLVEDGANHLLLERPIRFHGPARLLHGQRDPDVPWQLALAVAERLESDDVRIAFVKDGDHRLSRPQDLALLIRTVEEMIDA
jgi:pimeloyl-ACP methyl ester carboxylesterase